MDLDLDKYARRMHCVNSLYETACTRDCITATATLLNDRALPRLHRIKALVLHASVIGDWYRANVRLSSYSSRSSIPGSALTFVSSHRNSASWPTVFG